MLSNLAARRFIPLADILAALNPTLAGFVPYIGGTNDLDLSSHGIFADNFNVITANTSQLNVYNQTGLYGTFNFSCSDNNLFPVDFYTTVTGDVYGSLVQPITFRSGYSGTPTSDVTMNSVGGYGFILLSDDGGYTLNNTGINFFGSIVGFGPTFHSGLTHSVTGAIFDAIFNAYFTSAGVASNFIGIGGIFTSSINPAASSGVVKNLGAYFRIDSAIEKGQKLYFDSVLVRWGDPTGYAPENSLNIGTAYIFSPSSGKITINATRLNIASLPTSSTGLATGDLWCDTTGGLNIVKVK